jgi:hypothetical protein
MSTMRRKGTLLVGFAVAAALATAGTAQATITIGSNLNSTPTSNMTGCNTPCTAVNLSLPAANQAANGLTSTVNGTVTSWMAKANTGTNLAMQVLRATGGANYTSLNTSSAVNFAGPVGGPFTTSQDLKIGDTVGLRDSSGNLIYAATAGGTTAVWYLAPAGPLGDGSTRPYDVADATHEVLVQATIEPSSKLQFDAPVLNKKKGTATMVMRVPNSGTLAYPTNGMSITGPTNVGSSGDFSLFIKATGKPLKKLKKKGKVTLSPTITFTPTNGNVAASTTKLTLHKKNKKKK